jgi:6,7-dimethyl-8-ribityllumazine synthase
MEEGLQGEGLCFGLVVSRFNPEVTDGLRQGALAVLKKQGVPSYAIAVVEVPGAFEIPGVAQQMAESGEYDAIICLGAVIRGETDHYSYICSEVSRGIGHVALEWSLPVIFGVLTTETLEQAMARSSGATNKGAEAALSAIEMGWLYRKLKEGRLING